MSAYDLLGGVFQSSVNKLINSITYPFSVVEANQGFPGCSKSLEDQIGENAPYYEYTNSEIQKLIENAVDNVCADQDSRKGSPDDEIYSFACSIVEQAKKALEVARASNDSSDESRYEGPEKSELKAIVEGGAKELVNTLRSDFGMYAWCSHLSIKLMQKPSITLSSPQIDLSGVQIKTKATGELWSKYPWWNCYKFCTKWKKVIKCKRVAKVTVSLTVNADAYAEINAKGALVIVRGVFNRLRLAYNILDQIPLEGLANRVLDDRLVKVFDASKFIATVPMMESSFVVESIELPENSRGIEVGITLTQV